MALRAAQLIRNLSLRSKDQVDYSTWSLFTFLRLAGMVMY